MQAVPQREPSKLHYSHWIAFFYLLHTICPILSHRRLKKPRSPRSPFLFSFWSSHILLFYSHQQTKTTSFPSFKEQGLCTHIVAHRSTLFASRTCPPYRLQKPTFQPKIPKILLGTFFLLCLIKVGTVPSLTDQ